MATTAEYNLGEYIFPRGWFMVAEALEATKKPVALRYFGQDWVMYRGESGRVVVMDAYCPHMGTHFSNNETSFVVVDGHQVEGDTITCPYHEWKFGPDGQCVEIPYSPAPIPKTACVQSLETREWGGVIFVWYDPEKDGSPEYDLPELTEWDDPTWINWKIDQLGKLNCHPTEIIDNMADKAHFGPIHGSSNMQHFENELDGHILIQRLAGGHKTLSDDILVNDTWYTGPGILMSRMQGLFESFMLITHTPIEDGIIRAWHALSVKASGENPSEEEKQMATQFQEFSRLAVMQDYEVWENKRPCLQHLQVIGDGPFGKLRTWYQQFYNPRKDTQSYQMRANGVYITKGTARDPWDKPTKR